MATDRQRHHAPEGEAPSTRHRERPYGSESADASRACVVRAAQVIVEPVLARSKKRVVPPARAVAKSGANGVGVLTHNLLKIWRHEYALSTV